MSGWAQREREWPVCQAAAEERVDRWLYGAWDWHDPRPLVAERHGHPPSRPPGPTRRRGDDEYGIAASGEVVLARRRDARGAVAADDVALHHPDGVEWRLAFYGAGGFYVMRRTLRVYEEDGRPARCVMELGEGRLSVETYGYDGAGRVATIEEVNDGPDMGEPRALHVATYTPDGRLALLTEDVAGFGVEYRLLRAPLKHYARSLEDQLVAAITRVVEDRGRRDPVSAVSIAFMDLLPPLVGVAGSEEWAMARETADDTGALWNPAHFEFALSAAEDFPFPDPDAYAEAAAALDQEGDDDDFAAVAVAVARRVNAVAWPAEVVAPDFAVVAVEYSMDDLRRWAMQSLPAPRFSQLVGAGLI